MIYDGLSLGIMLLYCCYYYIIKSSHWNREENRREFLQWVESRFDIRNHEDWYNVTKGEFIEKGGGQLLEQYDGSPSKMLSAIYPNVEWHPWIFGCADDTYWGNINNRRTFLDWVASRYHIKRCDQWCHVGDFDINNLGGLGLIRYHGIS
jgi:hypothetical protein